MAKSSRWVEGYLKAVRAGASNRAAAKEAGVGYWVPLRMYRSDATFRRRVDAAREQGAHRKPAAPSPEEAARTKRLATLERRVNRMFDGLLTYAEYARMSGRTREAVRQAVGRGNLPSIETKFGRLIVTSELPGSEGGRT